MLAQTLSRRGSTILGAQVARSEGPGYTREMRVGPPEKWLNPAVRIGDINLPIDADGFIRRAPATDQDLIPFAMAAATVGCPDLSRSELGP